MFKTHISRLSVFCLSLVCLYSSGSVYANNVEILSAELHNRQSSSRDINPGDISHGDTSLWDISVTLKHTDTGWDHYADAWRIVDDQGHILGERILHHPHIDEQPFTRSLNNLSLPLNTEIIYIEAHDKIHGWAKTHLTIDLKKAHKGQLLIKNR